jgi:hypothetical protein
VELGIVASVRSAALRGCDRDGRRAHGSSHPARNNISCATVVTGRSVSMFCAIQEADDFSMLQTSWLRRFHA